MFPHRDITQPRDMITIPIGNNSYTHFCGQFCLSIFRHKTKQPSNASKLPEKPVERKPEKPAERAVDSQVCSVCKIVNRVRDGAGREATRHESAVYNLSTRLMCFWFVPPPRKPIEHEVTHQGRLHKLCSNACFITWRNKWQLAMNCCEGCGLYCNSNAGSCQTLTLDRSQLNFCSPTCISTYKQVGLARPADVSLAPRNPARRQNPLSVSRVCALCPDEQESGRVSELSQDGRGLLHRHGAGPEGQSSTLLFDRLRGTESAVETRAQR